MTATREDRIELPGDVMNARMALLSATPEHVEGARSAYYQACAVFVERLAIDAAFGRQDAALSPAATAPVSPAPGGDGTSARVLPRETSGAFKDALSDIERVEQDLATFDGDRRGIVAALGDAERRLYAVLAADEEDFDYRVAQIGLKAMRAALVPSVPLGAGQACAVPAGWKLVPEEATNSDIVELISDYGSSERAAQRAKEGSRDAFNRAIARRDDLRSRLQSACLGARR